MELRSLRYFLAVADEGNFRRAAHSLMITQPPLSREIQRLERELGSVLFDRTTQPVTLTPAGRALAQEAREVLARVDVAIASTRRAASGTEEIRIGFLGAAANGVLPRAVRGFRASHPHVNLVLQEHESGREQLDHLRQSDLDVAVVREPSSESALRSQLLVDEPFVAVLPSDHPLAVGDAPLSLKQLAGEPFVFWPRTSAPNPFDAAMQTFRRLGLSMPIVQEATGVQTVLGLVSAGLGVSLLPESVSSLRREGVVIKALQHPRPTIPLCAVWRRDNYSASVRDFVAALLTAAGNAAHRPERYQGMTPASSK